MEQPAIQDLHMLIRRMYASLTVMIGEDIRFVEKFEQLITSLDFEPDIIFTLPKCYNEASHMLEYWMDKSEYEQIFEVQITRALR